MTRERHRGFAAVFNLAGKPSPAVERLLNETAYQKQQKSRILLANNPGYPERSTVRSIRNITNKKLFGYKLPGTFSAEWWGNALPTAYSPAASTTSRRHASRYLMLSLAMYSGLGL